MRIGVSGSCYLGFEKIGPKRVGSLARTVAVGPPCRQVEAQRRSLAKTRAKRAAQVILYLRGAAASLSLVTFSLASVSSLEPILRKE